MTISGKFVLALALAAGLLAAAPAYARPTLAEAATEGDAAWVKELLNTGEDPDTADRGGYTALHLAAERGKLKAVEALLAAKRQWVCKWSPGWVRKVPRTNVNAVAKNGATALILAASGGHADVVRALLAAGADKDAKAKSGATALFIAAQNGQAGAVQALIDGGADVNFRADDGHTALYLAAYRGHFEAVQVLLAAKADANAAAANGVTPLMGAAYAGRMDVTRALLAAGANVNAKTRDGKTALSIALKYNRPEEADMLRQRQRVIPAVKSVDLSPSATP